MPRNYPQQRIHIGAYGFCRDATSRLLLVRVSGGPDHGSWTLPGGGVLWGEDPSQAVLREMEEETGLVDLQTGSIAAIYSHAYHQFPDNPLSDLHHIGIIYHLELDNFNLRNEVGGTTDLCHWFADDEAGTLPLTPLGEFGVNLAWPSNDGQPGIKDH